MSPLINAVEGIKYQRSIPAGLTGPAIGPPIDLIEKGVALKERNSDGTNTAERNFAGAVYDVAINPAINLVASNLAGRGAVAGSAIILGKGKNDKGMLPDVRGSFVDSMAGPKQERRSDRYLRGDFGWRQPGNCYNASCPPIVPAG
jgi:hypothetical protein